MGLIDTWFIETWSVLDGIAFASLREGEEIRVSVALMPPDWRAVPIGNPSTAWTAGRFGFQERLFFPNDVEVAFPDLEVIRELVRRAYIAGGLGLADPTVEAQAVSPPEGLDSGSAAQLLFEYEGDPTDIEDFVKTHLDELMKALALGTYTINNAVQWWEKNHGPLHVRVAKMRDLNAWTHLHPWDVPLQYRTTRPEMTAISAELLFSLPALNPESLGRTPAPRSLGDQLLLMSASRDQSERLSDPSQFIALFVAADFLSGASMGRAVYPEDLLASALCWLAEQIPNRALARVRGLDELMEDLIADIATYRLNPQKRTNPTGAPNRRRRPGAAREDDSRAQGASGA